MAEYIDREAAIGKANKFAYIHHTNRHEETAEAFLMFVQELKFLPSADVKPVVHSKWIERNIINNMQYAYLQSARCSKCGKYHTTPYLYNFNEYPFCPWCGADMEGEDNGSK